jgi:hypothetical protein
MKHRQNLCNSLFIVTYKGLNLYTAGVEKVQPMRHSKMLVIMQDLF